MIQHDYTFYQINSETDAISMARLFNQAQPIAGAFDTETTGLHIMLDRPFFFQFGWLDQNNSGLVFTIDLEANPDLGARVIQAWHRMAATLPVYLAHNTKFDLHMLMNFGESYQGNNISDTMFYIRYAHNALTPANGGPPMKLKPYAAQYIDASAKLHEKELDQERTAIAKSLNQKLKKRLGRGYTLAEIQKTFKDPIFQLTDLPDETRQIYLTWLEEDVPEWLPITSGLAESKNVPYHKLNREVLQKYAAYDIVWVLEVWAQLAPVIEARQQQWALNLENKLIYPLLEMERVGFQTDKQYLQQCGATMREYIIERRVQFYELAGEVVGLGQHARIKQLFQTKFGQHVASTSADTLQQLRASLTRKQEAADCVRFIVLLEELRTLEKWYAVYINRFLRDLEHTDRLYTTINQVGTVSGRVTSDFQQFPNNAIQTEDGQELFHPRRMIQVSPAPYSSIVYLDFSQIELRFQAFYTILVGHPDLNLCRAYMPYKCTRKIDGVPFDYEDPEHIQQARQVDWVLEEDPDTLWHPTDVHGATTQVAFDITPDHPEYSHLRNVGKRVNFAKNYGAQYQKICQMFPEYDADRCKKINDAYYTAFPGVKKYHDYCYNRSKNAYTKNLFGVRYYGVSGHKLINLLVQGSAAYYLKLKILDLYNYAHSQNLQTRWQMQIHDELSWEFHQDDNPEHVFAFKQIMETWPDSFIPLVAELEVTKTTWAEKEAINNLEQLQIYLGLRP